MKKQKETEIVIDEVKQGRVKIWLCGTSPLIFNSMSAKVRQELLYPKGRKTAAAKAQQMKHDPISEYRDSVYRLNGSNPTRLVFPTIGLKAAMSSAALEVPGAKKAQIGRLVRVEGEYMNVYGVPKMFMAVTRSADMNRTPDIRTRAIVPEWCCSAEVTFVMPTLNETAIARLVEMAGLVIGIGDFRQEKGKGNYGSFRLATEKEVQHIIKGGAAKEQAAALEKPEMYNLETQQLWEWFDEERVKRGQ
jgi:hypothetical protein